MTISKKLYSTVAALGGVAFLVAGLGAWNLRDVNGMLDETIGKTAVKLDQVNSLRAHSWEMAAAMRGSYVFADLKNPAKVEEAFNDWKAAHKGANEIIAEMRPLLVTEEGRQMLARFESTLGNYATLAQQYIQLCRDGKLDQVQDIASKVLVSLNTLDEIGQEFRGLQLKLLKEAEAEGEKVASRSNWTMAVLACLIAAIAWAATIAVRGINRTLVDSIGSLAESAEQVGGAASQVSASSQSLAQGTSEQAASVEETSSSSEEINSMARANSEKSLAAAALMGQSQQRFVETRNLLDQSVAAMSEINTQSDKIARIIKVIDEIAFQTNILALNAAVEAARAGEAGMGFAVVADEVRNLAQRCAQAAKDTSTLIEESIAKSNDGKAKVDHVADAFTAISDEVNKVKALVDEVSMGSLEQSKGIEQVRKAMTEIEQVTQRAAASAEESASASEELSAQSVALKDVVGRLAAMVGGTADGAAGRPGGEGSWRRSASASRRGAEIG